MIISGGMSKKVGGPVIGGAQRCCCNSTGPVTIVDSEASREVVRSICCVLMKLLPNARMEGLADANHAMLDTHREAVARLIAT